MLTIKKYDISLTRGDSAYITLIITDKTGQVVDLTVNDKVRVQVRDYPNTGNLMFEGRLTRSGDNYLWYIRPEDTEDFDVGKYYWDAQVEFSNGDVFTFIPVSKFELLNEVTIAEDI